MTEKVGYAAACYGCAQYQPLFSVSLCHRRRYVVAGHCCAQNQSLSISPWLIVSHYAMVTEKVGYAGGGYCCAQYQSLFSVSHYAIVEGTLLLVTAVHRISPSVSHYAIVDGTLLLVTVVRSISPPVSVSHYAIVTGNG